MASAHRVGASPTKTVNGLLFGQAWKGPISVAICDRAPKGDGYAPQQVGKPGAAFAEAVHDVLDMVEQFSGAKFTGGGADKATVRLFTADALAFPGGHGTVKLPLGGYSFFPGGSKQAGDVWIGTDVARDLEPGGYGFRVLMHELGHALGLKHPHERGPFGPLPEHLDGAEWTVMSARTLPGDPVSKGLGIADGGFSQTFMPLDVAALQHLYGADFSDRGDDRYRFDPMERTVSRTIWDGGGHDTYDFVRFPLGVKVDLAPGGVCVTGQEAHMNGATNDAPVLADGAIHNAFLYRNDWRSAIEDAVGGMGDDTIAGNKLDNMLKGNFGDDRLSGLAGADRLYGDVGDDRLDGGTGGDALTGAVGNDTLSGGSGNDALFGGFGADVLLGGAGADVLTGGNDGDTLRGGGGNDVLTGGTGADVFGLDAGADRITDFRPGVDRVDVADPAAAFVTQTAAGAVVHGEGGALLLLAGVAAASLSVWDFC